MRDYNEHPFLCSVTVVLAVKNGDRFIDESLKSILASDRFVREILVVDDSSTDRTREIAERYPKVRVVNNSRGGAAAGYNAGVQNSAADLIAFNSHDDLWAENKLELQLDVLAKNPELEIIAGYAECFLENPNYVPPGFRKELLKPHVSFTPEAMLVRKSAFDKVGLFNEEQITAEDVDWICRARDCALPSAIVEHLLVRKRIHDANTHLTQPNNQFLFQALARSVRRKREMTQQNSSEQPDEPST